MGWAHGIIEYEELHDLHRSQNVKSSFHELFIIALGTVLIFPSAKWMVGIYL